MARLLMLWSWFLSALRMFFSWMFQPSVVFIVLIMIAIGGVSYLVVGNPATALPLKAFVLKALPKLAIFFKKAVAKIPMLLSKAAMKRYVKAFLLFITLGFATDEFVERMSDKLAVVKEKFHLHFAVKPKLFWENSTLTRKILIVALVFTILISVPGAIMFGLLVLPVALIQAFLLLLWNKFLVKVGADVAFAKIHNLLGKLLSPLVPDWIEDPFVRYKDRFGQWLSDSGYKFVELHEDKQLAKRQAQLKADWERLLLPSKEEPPPMS